MKNRIKGALCPGAHTGPYGVGQFSQILLDLKAIQQSKVRNYLFSGRGEHCSLLVAQQLRQTKVRDPHVLRPLHCKYAISHRQKYSKTVLVHTSKPFGKQSAPHSRQITTPTPHQSILTGRMHFLMSSRQCQSTECTINSNNTIIGVIITQPFYSPRTFLAARSR